MYLLYFLCTVLIVLIINNNLSEYVKNIYEYVGSLKK